MALRVTLACGATDRTLPLIVGDVRPTGIDLTFLRMYPEEVFWRMTRHAEFDAAEMSLSSYVLRRSRGDDALQAHQTLSDMLLDGELDAIMGPRPPRGFPGPRVLRLFGDFKSVEQAYFRRTRVFPIMHTVVIRRELLDREPWVARSLYDAFCES